MFALEINFKDGTAEPETVLVQRPSAIIGASDFAHVVIGDLSELPYEMHVYRGVGRTFRTKAVPRNKTLKLDLPEQLFGQHSHAANFDLGPISLSIEALDIDLVVGAGEAIDRSAVRILRRAAQELFPRFPAVAVGGENPLAVSFAQDMSLLIGRDRECGLRLESPDVSGQHARISYEQGIFWIEDLGSTNGTYIASQQVSGKVQIAAGQPIVIGRSTVIYAIESDDNLQFRQSVAERDLQAVPEERYPMLVSMSEVARPPRLILQEGAVVRIGREPSSDLWLGAPHVSRKHCTVEYLNTGKVVLTDLSMNGLAYDGGVLAQGESVQLGDRPAILNFGGGITVAVCLSEEDERVFSESNGDPHVFLNTKNISSSGTLSEKYIKEKRKLIGKSTFAIRTIRFLRQLRLGHRLALMFTVFLVVLATALVLKMIFPLFLIGK